MSMDTWTDIACQRGHETHESVTVHVDLGKPHGYKDLPLVPSNLARAFDMEIFDPALYPVDDGPYCSAHDAVSETIQNTGVWEPAETILTLMVCREGDFVLDVGAQIGWFTLLAASCGARVLALDADADPLRLLQKSAKLNGWFRLITTGKHRVGTDATPPFFLSNRIRLAKVDIEGAENAAVRWLAPVLAVGGIDHLMIEVTPIFADYYPQLVTGILEYGYVGYRLPEKQRPPAVLNDPERDLVRLSGDVEAEVAAMTQDNIWFRHKDASW